MNTTLNIAIITGASSGMGRDFAKQLDMKFDFDYIWLIARRESLLRDLQKELKNKSVILPYDLTNQDDLNKFHQKLESESPNVKFLVNSSGFGKFGTYKEVDLNTSMQMIDINVKALVTVTMECLPYMNKGSKIINLGSASSFFPLKNFNIYASTKAFVVHYSNALHDELKERGISCTVVCPGWVYTEFFKVAQNGPVGPKKFKPMLSSEKVVKKAIKASIKGKKNCVYNCFTKFHKWSARFLPRCFVLKIWDNMQKKTK